MLGDALRSRANSRRRRSSPQAGPPAGQQRESLLRASISRDNDEISCVDVLYDLAFLLMDLWRRHLPAHANAVWNRYLLETGNLGGVALMPLFLSCRAAIRAKTSATALRVQADSARVQPSTQSPGVGDRDRVRDLQKTAREYLEMAERLLDASAPCLVAVGGLSGSGKSTLASALAPLVGAVPGAIVLRSDELRKQLCGVPMLTRLGPDSYAAEITDTVYATLASQAGLALSGGYSAIVDAVFLRAADRQALEHVARVSSVPLVALWLDAPVQTLLERLQQRQHDASDADAAVLRLQRTQDPGAISWHTIDGSLSSDAVLLEALSFMQGHINDAPGAMRN